jgi:peptidoglycan/LPS O-acetylase OafA/YrhL
VFLFFAFVQRDIWIWFNRADTIAVGVMIGLLSKTAPYVQLGRFASFLRYGVPRAISTTALLGFLLFGISGPLTRGIYRPVPALATITCGLLVLLASYGQDYVFGKNIATRIMAAIGERSYSIYLTHNLAMATATETFLRLAPSGTKFGPAWDVPMTATAVVFLAIFSEASYRLI